MLSSMRGTTRRSGCAQRWCQGLDWLEPRLWRHGHRAVLAPTNLVLVGAVLFFAVLLFQVVTLPVEFNTSNRAKALIVGHGWYRQDEKGPRGHVHRDP